MTSAGPWRITPAPLYRQFMCSWPVSVATSSHQAIPQRTINTRASITFLNPGTVDVFVCQALNANGAAQPAVVNGPGMILIMAGGGPVTFESGDQGAWNCIAASTAALTVVELFV